MHPPNAIITLAALLSPTFTAALPQLSDATSPNPTVFYRWSSDPACSNTGACVSDCREAATQVCEKVAQAQSDPIQNVTVNKCTAFYMWEIGNTVPTKDSCYSAYSYINDAGAKGAGADGCGGTVGGALGFDKNGNRTRDPLFALYPSDGNGNCFKAPDDDTPPKPMDELSNGQKLPMNAESCPVSASRKRRRDALEQLEGRRIGGNAGPLTCIIGAAGGLAGCSALCIEWVATMSWWTGWVLPAVGSLACFATCYGIDLPLALRCILDSNDRHTPRAVSQAQSNPCENINNWGFECPAMRNGLLEAYSCPGSSSDPALVGGHVVDSKPGGGVINT